jgi:hypothetical protein
MTPIRWPGRQPTGGGEFNQKKRGADLAQQGSRKPLQCSLKRQQEFADGEGFDGRRWPPRLTAKDHPSKFPSQWLVKATWPDGKVRRIRGFSSWEVAVEWIENGSQAYVRSLKKPWSPLRRRERRRVLRRPKIDPSSQGWCRKKFWCCPSDTPGFFRPPALRRPGSVLKLQFSRVLSRVNRD